MSSSSIKIVSQVLILFFAFSMKAQTTDSLKLESKKSVSLESYRQVFWDNLPKPNNWTNDYENLFSNEEEMELLLFYLMKKPQKLFKINSFLILKKKIISREPKLEF